MSRHRSMIPAAPAPSSSAPVRPKAAALEIEGTGTLEKPIAVLPLVVIVSMVWATGTVAASLAQLLW